MALNTNRLYEALHCLGWTTIRIGTVPAPIGTTAIGTRDPREHWEVVLESPKLGMTRFAGADLDDCLRELIAQTVWFHPELLAQPKVVGPSGKRGPKKKPVRR